jgi:hypothetical protein
MHHIPRAITQTRPTSTKRAGALTAALFLALGPVACGSTVSTSSFKGEAKAVAQRISDLQSNVTSSNAQKLCANDFSRAARARLNAAGGCTQALKRQLGAISNFELTVEKVAVSGATATARVKSGWSGKLRSTTLVLVKEGGGWRIARLG